MPDESALERLLAQPVPSVVGALSTIHGDIVILGAGGKMGPSLARLAARSLRDAGHPGRVIAVARFSDGGLRAGLEADGVETVSCDLVDAAQLAALPDASNVIYMVGQKFGTSGDEARTWGVNAWLPGAVAARYAHSRVVAFSTGNVYPLSPTDWPGPVGDGPDRPGGRVCHVGAGTGARPRVLLAPERDAHGDPATQLCDRAALWRAARHRRAGARRPAGGSYDGLGQRDLAARCERDCTPGAGRMRITAPRAQRDGTPGGVGALARRTVREALGYGAPVSPVPRRPRRCSAMQRGWRSSSGSPMWARAR